MQCACLHEYVYVPLSVSWHPLWGNWRSRWNAADMSFGATNKSIKQHTHTHTHTHAQTKGSILLGLNHSQCCLRCGSRGSVCHHGLSFPHYEKWSGRKGEGLFATSHTSTAIFAYQGIECLEKKSLVIIVCSLSVSNITLLWCVCVDL